MASQEVTVLLGNNGAGKSSLIKILMGILPFKETEGDVIFRDGEEIISLKREPEKFRSFIRFCPQDDILIPELTCKEHLEISYRLAGYNNTHLISNKILSIASKMQLSQKIDYKVH